MSTPLDEEIINEIGTQTLAIFGLNIFINFIQKNNIMN